MTPQAQPSAKGLPGGGIVSCAIGGEQFAFRASDAREIVRAERMQRAPGPDGAAGTVEVDGEAVPVFPLDTSLLKPARRAAPGRVTGHIVITRGQAGSAGWLVDRITRSAVGAVSPARLPRMVGPVATRWFEGVLRVGDRLLLLISPANLDPRAGAGGAPPALPDEEQVAAPAPAPGGQESQGPPMVVLFSSPALPRCGAPQCALSGRRILAVIPSVPVIAVPGSVRHVAGVIMWRDEAVPVVDAREPRDRMPSEHARFIVARWGTARRGGRVAFECSGAVVLHKPTREDRPMEDATVPPFVTGVFGVGGEPVALLDLDGLLSTLTEDH